jgi:hypothetical protein
MMRVVFTIGLAVSLLISDLQGQTTAARRRSSTCTCTRCRPTTTASLRRRRARSTDDMLALLFYHPQVNVDVGVISWQLPRAEFHRYLRRLVEAGFGKRVMFGSDQLLFPEMIRVAIENVESADSLSAEQKRDIFYNNAARFLWLEQKP